MSESTKTFNVYLVQILVFLCTLIRIEFGLVNNMDFRGIHTLALWLYDYYKTNIQLQRVCLLTWNTFIRAYLTKITDMELIVILEKNVFVFRELFRSKSFSVRDNLNAIAS